MGTFDGDFLRWWLWWWLWQRTMMVDIDDIFVVGVCCRCLWFLMITGGVIVIRYIFFDDIVIWFRRWWGWPLTMVRKRILGTLWITILKHQWWWWCDTIFWFSIGWSIFSTLLFFHNIPSLSLISCFRFPEIPCCLGVCSVVIWICYICDWWQ